MSHGLDIYVKHINAFKEEESEAQEPQYIFEYCGNHPLFRRFQENAITCYCGDNDENKRELTAVDFKHLEEDILTDIKKAKASIETSKDFKNPTTEILEHVLTQQEYLSELEEEYEDFKILKGLYDLCSWSNTKLYFNTY